MSERVLWPLVVVESPYAGDVDKNTAFAQNVCRWCVEEGYNPYASHLFFTQFLDDNDPDERATGIACGLEWGKNADRVVVALRPGEDMSRGMARGVDAHVERGAEVRVGRFTQDGELLRWEAA